MAGSSSRSGARVAHSIGVDVTFMPYVSPGEVPHAADAGAWTLALMCADPIRAQCIGFTEPYVEIESAYLVLLGSDLSTPAEVEQPSHTVAAFTSSTYEKWLRRNLKHATLVAATSFEDSLQRCRDRGLSALANLRSKLIDDREIWPGSRVLDENFIKVLLTIGTQKGNTAGPEYLQGFVKNVKSTGVMVNWIAKHKPDGLSVADSTCTLLKSTCQGQPEV